MSSYLPAKKTFAVCSSQLDSVCRTFVIHPDLRGKTHITVNFNNSKFPFLTEKDRKLGEEFSCKTCWSSGVGTIAFGAGVMAGLAIAAAVATVPILGWVVGGFIALGCLAWGLYTLFSTPTCNQMIEYDESRWIMPHQTVHFDTHLAVVKTSFILCKEGGLIVPFISETVAMNAASTISMVNKVDMGTNILGNFLSGGLLGFSMGYSGLFLAGKDTVLGVVGAFLVIQPLTKLERLGIRGGSDLLMDNPYYDNMIENESVSFILDVPKSPSEALWDIGAVYRDLNKIKELASEAGASKTQISEIDAAIKSAEANGGSMAATKNHEAKIVFEKAQNGDYGESVKKYFTNSKGNSRGMNRQSNYEKAVQNKNQELSQTNKKTIITKTTRAINIITLILPFVSTALDEVGLITIANAAQEDCNNNISATAKMYYIESNKYFQLDCIRQ
jgi:hypothetical protein